MNVLDMTKPIQIFLGFLSIFVSISVVSGVETEMKPYTEKIPGHDVRFEMVPIPGGTFAMGSPASEPDRADDEGPTFQVAIEPFWMGKHEVTWAEYRLFMADYDLYKGNPTKISEDKWADAVSFPTPLYDPTYVYNKGKKPNHPAVCMTQMAVKQYAKWLSLLTGKFYRIPTEAEWEYACRAGTTTAYYFGDDEDALDDYEWYLDNSDEKYHPVGTKKPNPWGLHDMSGNVSEWVLDRYEIDRFKQFGGKKDAQSPICWRRAILWPTEEDGRCVRGGNWDSFSDECRSAVRIRSNNKEWKLEDPQFWKSMWWFTDAQMVGFRLIRPLNPPPRCEWNKYWNPDLEEFRDRLKKEDRHATTLIEMPEK